MQGYSFAHMETWSQKGGQQSKRKNGQRAWTVSNILDEAERKFLACDHVDVPDTDPFIFPGSCKTIDELREAHEQVCKVKVACNYTNPKTGKKSRRYKTVRKDAHTLFTAVFSLPVRSSEALADPLLLFECKQILSKAIEHEASRVRRLGGEFALGVLHTDEEFIHVHFMALNPTVGSVNELHPGKAARDELRRSYDWGPIDTGQANRVYCDEMRSWQDDLHEQVFSKAGLLRLGPRRDRLSRTEYKKLKQAQEKFANVQETQERIDDQIQDADELHTGAIKLYNLVKKLQDVTETEHFELSLEQDRLAAEKEDHAKTVKAMEEETKQKQTRAEVQSFFLEELMTDRMEFSLCEQSASFRAKGEETDHIKLTKVQKMHQMFNRAPEVARQTLEYFKQLSTKMETRLKAKARAELDEERQDIDTQVETLKGIATEKIRLDSKNDDQYRPCKGVSDEEAEPFLSRIRQRPKAVEDISKWVKSITKKIRDIRVDISAQAAVLELFNKGALEYDLEGDRFRPANGQNGENTDNKNQLERVEAAPKAARQISRRLAIPLKKAARAQQEADKREKMLSAALEKVDNIVSLAQRHMTAFQYNKFKQNVGKISEAAHQTLNEAREAKQPKKKDDDQR